MNRKLHQEQCELLEAVARLNTRSNLIMQFAGLLQEHMTLKQRMVNHVAALNQELVQFYKHGNDLPSTDPESIQDKEPK